MESVLLVGPRAHLSGQPVVLLGDAVRVEAVGGDDVGARVEKARMDAVDDLRAGQAEEVVVSDQLALVVRIPLAPEILFVELVGLDRGSHGAVQDQHPFGRSRLQRAKARGAPGGAHAAPPAVPARRSLTPSAWQIARVSSARFRV